MMSAVLSSEVSVNGKTQASPMANPMRIFAVTGDAVARFGLGDIDAELGLQDWQPRCIAVDPRDPRRVYVGTMDSGLWFSDDGGAGWHLGRIDDRARAGDDAASH